MTARALRSPRRAGSRGGWSRRSSADPLRARRRPPSGRTAPAGCTKLHPGTQATRLGMAAPAREPWRMLLLAPPPATARRERLARLERPLLLAGLALVALHLL